ncbi:hypothetical protein [Fructobacillus ficulneus]|uniref:1,4-dihydroxy-2-naphthoate octaprenyltransferase n=1 Tax=Fructobacillus ficulneus TaxID=157463 RepID=A0A0K8MFT0_9LACO|nr:hypothetical protein [Fructobacillus ficulneus]GAO99365.1 hypothetical protein FFIC_091930 [Fructobacillus ficulneus]
MQVEKIVNRLRASNIWQFLMPVLLGPAYSWWRYHRFSFVNSLALVIAVILLKVIWTWIWTKKSIADRPLTQINWLIDLLLPYLLVVIQIWLNTGFQITGGFLVVWFGVAWPMMLLALAIHLAPDVRKFRSEDYNSEEMGQVQRRAVITRPVFLALPVLAYGEILLLTLSGYMPLLAWSLVVLFPLVFAQALAVGLESDLDKSADLPIRNVFLTGAALILVLLVAG